MSTGDRPQHSAGSVGDRFEFETLLAVLSSRFINLPPAEVDRGIEDALRRVCEYLDIGYALLWQWSENAPGVIEATHAYPADKNRTVGSAVVQEHYPWSVAQVRAGRMIALASLADAPAEAAVDAASARLAGIKSSLILPLAVGGEPPVGALAFNTMQAERDWPDALVKRLQLVAQVLANALARQRADEATRRSEARLATGADLAGLAFYELDYGAGTSYVDDRFRDLFGLPPDRASGLEPMKYWIEHLHPDDRERVLDLRQQLHDGLLERLVGEYRYLHQSRGEIWIQHVARVTGRDHAGHPRTAGVFRDITARKQAEEALRHSLAEIERLKDRLQAESDYLKAEIQVAAGAEGSEREEPGHPEGPAPGGAGGAHGLNGPDLRRDGYGQGAARPGDSSAQPSRPPCHGEGQLCGAAVLSGGE